MIAQEQTRMVSRFDEIAVRTAEVRVVDTFENFVADQRIPKAELDIQAVAHRGAQRDISLLDVEVRAAVAGTAVADGAVVIRIRSEDEVGFVTGRPLSFIQRLL